MELVHTQSLVIKLLNIYILIGWCKKQGNWNWRTYETSSRETKWASS